MTQRACKGTNCPVRESCLRFKPIRTGSDTNEYFTITPYNDLLNKCKYLLLKTKPELV